MRVVIFDDEMQIALKLKDLLEQYSADKQHAVEVKCFSSEQSVESYIKREYADIFFCDIHVSDNENYGIELAKKIRRSDLKTHIVFLTAFEDKHDFTYAPDIRSSKFLKKPVSYEQVTHLMDCIFSLIEAKTCTIIHKYLSTEVLLSSICYFEREGRTVSVYTDESYLQTYQTLDSIFDTLNDNFIYIDRGIIINLEKIKNIDYKHNKIVFNNGIEKFYARSHEKKIKNHFLGG